MVPHAVACMRKVAVCIVLAPALVTGPEELLHFFTSSIQQRADDGAGGEVEYRRDSAKSLGPCASQKLLQDSLGLVIERMRGRDRVHGFGLQQRLECSIAKMPRCFFHRFMPGSSVDRGIDASTEDLQTTGLRQRLDKSLVPICFRAANAVMNVDDREHQSQGVTAFQQGKQKRDRIGATGDSYSKPLPRIQVSSLDGDVGAWKTRGRLRSKLGAVHRLGHVDQSDGTTSLTNGGGSRLSPDQAKVVRSDSLYTPSVMQVFVILPAAGLGTRMSPGHSSSTSAKQFLMLGGIPILIHSLRAFAAVSQVTAIFVAVRGSEMKRARELMTEFGLGSRVQIVEGGDTRQESVSRALQAIHEEAAVPAINETDMVLVHDAVRPLIDADTIARTIEAVSKHGAAIVALPAVDTIKQVERTADGAIIRTTIPREYIVQAQTPQGFRLDLLKRAFAEAEADGFCGTDEASLVERAGTTVAVVAGSAANMKITQPGDLELAEFYLARSASKLAPA